MLYRATSFAIPVAELQAGNRPDAIRGPLSPYNLRVFCLKLLPALILQASAGADFSPAVTCFFHASVPRTSSIRHMRREPDWSFYARQRRWSPSAGHARGPNLQRSGRTVFDDQMRKDLELHVQQTQGHGHHHPAG